MTQPPPPTPHSLPYARPATPAEAAPRRRRWWVWALPVALLVLVLMSLLTRPRRAFTPIPVDEFITRLAPETPEERREARFIGRVEWVRIGNDEVVGKFLTREIIPEKGHVLWFSVQLPPHTADWAFVKEIDARTGDAKVYVENDDSLLVNILLPLIPWLIIMSFVWFLIRRLAARPQPGPQLIVAGPGRWIPDTPAVATAPDATTGKLDAK